MNVELTLSLIFLGAIIAIIVLFLVSGLVFSAKFDRIYVGMSYVAVISMVGAPKSTVTSQEITTCVWKRIILRGWTKVFTVTFVDDKVVSVGIG